jgi:hypothetical protein
MNDAPLKMSKTAPKPAKPMPGPRPPGRKC